MIPPEQQEVHDYYIAQGLWRYWGRSGDQLLTFYWSPKKSMSDVSAYEKVMSAFMITVTRNLTNKSYLAGMQQLIEVFQDPDAKADRVARSLAGNFIPNILSHAQSAGGDVELKEVRNLWDALQKKIPGAASGLDARRNIIGEPYEAEGFEKSPLQLLNPFNPIAFSTKTGDPVLEEMANLHHGFTPPSPKLNGMLDLREHDAGNGRTAYDRWMELRAQVKVGGKPLRQALESLFKARSYKALDLVKEALEDNHV